MARRAILGLYLLAPLVVVVQRGLVGPPHNVFKIFRQSFWHLLAGQNLYAPYPAEQGGAPADLFKYSPTAAFLFAPIALPPYSVALLAWSLLGALLLWRALGLLLEPRPALLASLIVLPDLFAALQACSSNAQIAALMILAFVALERGRQLRGAVAIVAGSAIKLFPFAALTFALFHPRRWRFALLVVVVVGVAILLPLCVTRPGTLANQYRWWYAVEWSDARDVAFGLSAMSLVRHWTGGTWSNWPVQLAASVLLVAPLLLQRRQWPNPDFRRQYLASLLMYAVLFNHQAERASFVIASAGVAIWCVTPPDGTTALWPRTALALSAVVGLRTPPLLVVWIVAQLELYGWRASFPYRAPSAANLPPSLAGQPNGSASSSLAAEEL